MPDLTAWNNMTGIKAYRLADTKGLPKDEWLSIRQKGIGGSDIAAIAGLNPFKSAIEVFLDKTGRAEPIKENSKMKWGKLLEDPVAQEYSASTGKKVQRVNAVLQDTKTPHFLANIDRIASGNGQGNGILEVKCTSWAKAWDGGIIPDFYYTQLQWYLGVCGLAWGQFATLISGSDLLIPPVTPADPKCIHNLFVIADRFWTQNVLKDTPPPPDQNPATREAYKILYPDITDETITLPEALNPLIHTRKRLDTAIKEATSQKAAIDSQVLAHLKNSRYGITKDFKITRIKRTAPRFDAKAFKEVHPKIHSTFLVSSSTVYPAYNPRKT